MEFLALKIGKPRPTSVVRGGITVNYDGICICCKDRFEKRRKDESLRQDTKHIRTMCGNCQRFNYQEMRAFENDIYNSVVLLCRMIDIGKIDVGTVTTVLHLLQGKYPGYYRAINEHFLKSRCSRLEIAR